MIVLAVRFDISPEHSDVFIARVRRQGRESLEREPGCKRFDVAVDPERPTVVFLYELYADRAALDAHRETPHFKDYAAETAPMVIEKRSEIFELTQSVDL